MISLAEKVNEEVETNTTHVDEAVTTANGASQKATKASEEVQRAITEANTTLREANTAKVSAQESATASAGSAYAAAGSASAASGSAANAAASAKAVEDIAAGLGGFDGTATSVKATDTQGIVVAAGADSNAQALLDALARKVALELVSNTALTTKLADYLKKTDIVQTESTATNKVPSSAYLKQVKDSIDSNFLTLSNNTNGLKFRSYQTLVDIQTGFIDGKVCNIPLDITLAGLTEKPYALLINSCSQNGKQIRYDWDLSTKTVAIVSIEFDAQISAGTTVRLGIVIIGK